MPGDLEPRTDRAISRTGGGNDVQIGLRHEHREFELSWVEAGAIDLAVGAHRRAITVTAGECIVLPPCFEVTPRSAEAKIHQIAIAPGDIDAAANLLGQHARDLRRPRRIASRHRLSQLIRIFFQEAGADPVQANPFAASLLTAVVNGLVRDVDEEGTQHGSIDRRLRLALAAMENCYAERLTVAGLADIAGMARCSFLREFKSQLGVSPYHYLIGLRLQRAADQLSVADARSVLDIAFSCGFSDPGRFARSFRQRFGCNPRVYRTLHAH